MAKKKAKQDNVIEKTEQHSFTKKFSEQEISEKRASLSELLMEKFNEEQKIVSAKEAIKNGERKLKEVSKEVTDGGEWMSWTECEVKIYRDTNKKEYYYEGVLVDEVQAEEEDFQLEIEED